MRKKGYLLFCFSFLLFVFFSCSKRTLSSPIENNLSFPTRLAALNSNSFLLLNSSANNDYIDGSLQRYAVDTVGNLALENVLSVSSHATSLAVSPDSKIVALGFDSSQLETRIQFYDFSKPSQPVSLSHLTLNGFYQSGAKQSINSLGFFSPSSETNFYYLYGVVSSFPQDDGSFSNIPARVFVARVAKDFSSSQILFYLSYGVGDPNSLARQSTAWDNQDPSLQYMLGFSAPTYDAAHDLLIAFPTGTMGGFNGGTNTYPALPDPFTYFSGNGQQNLCNGVPCQIQPDYRAVSLAVVDFSRIIAGDPLNNSTYFVPLGWNQNGIPYAAVTNGTNLLYPNDSQNADKNSFSFQSNYWSSYWAGASNLGSQNSAACYVGSPSTTAENQYTVLGGNSLFVVKNGTNGNNDNSNNNSIGNGNEVFQITGLDILSEDITLIREQRGAVNPAGESDFSAISSTQIIDPYNRFYNSSSGSLKSTWLVGSSGSLNAGPLTSYMYSRTSNINLFDSIPTSVGQISVLNLGSGVCIPYWTRNSYLGSTTGAIGLDSAWLGASPTAIAPGTNSTYFNAVIDPTQPVNYQFPVSSGAESCVDLSPVLGSPKVFCVNFLNSSFQRFQVTSQNPVFLPF